MNEFLLELIYRQTGTTQSPGGQHAGCNVADVRVTHVPTGIMAQFGEHLSQHKNKQVAMEMVEWGLAAINYPHSVRPSNG